MLTAENVPHFPLPCLLPYLSSERTQPNHSVSASTSNWFDKPYDEVIISPSIRILILYHDRYYGTSLSGMLHSAGHALAGKKGDI